MNEKWLTEDWKALRELLPGGWEKKVRELGALKRARKVRDAGQLLRLILMHVGPGLSLAQAVARAARCGLPQISDVALIQRQRVAARESARKRGREASALSLLLCDYIVVVTSLPQSTFDARSLLRLYRLRWQIELAFKRLKSLLGTGHVPKVDPRSSRAWLQAKLLTCLLIEKIILESEVFSPWGFLLPEKQPLG